jgi:hypothetical protein
VTRNSPVSSVGFLTSMAYVSGCGTQGVGGEVNPIRKMQNYILVK